MSKTALLLPTNNDIVYFKTQSAALALDEFTRFMKENMQSCILLEENIHEPDGIYHKIETADGTHYTIPVRFILDDASQLDERIRQLYRQYA